MPTFPSAVWAKQSSKKTRPKSSNIDIDTFGTQHASHYSTKSQYTVSRPTTSDRKDKLTQNQHQVLQSLHLAKQHIYNRSNGSQMVAISSETQLMKSTENLAYKTGLSQNMSSPYLLHYFRQHHPGSPTTNNRKIQPPPEVEPVSYPNLPIKERPPKSAKGVRFSQDVTQPASAPIKAEDSKKMPMSEANLRKHSDDMRRMDVIGPMERVARWAQSIPENLSDPERPSSATMKLRTPPSSASRGRSLTTGGNPYLYSSSKAQLATYNITEDKEKKNKSLPALNEKPTFKERDAQTLYASLFPPQPKVEEPRSKSAGAGNITTTTSGRFVMTAGHTPKIQNDRGKLLCCLKVEIKTGVYRMLPVHEKDDSKVLASTFCKANNLSTSVDSLKEHIQLAMKTYS